MAFVASLVCFCLLWGSTLSALLPGIGDLMSQHLNIQLQSPIYQDGVTSTDQGGIITGKELYIQAKKMKYIQRQEGAIVTRRIEAEENLFFRFKNRVYIGDRVEFDLDNQTAVVYNGMTDTGPWFIGGSKFFLKPDGSAVVYDCYMTTDENEKTDWTIQAKEVYLSKNNTVKAQNVRFTVFTKSIFWLPTLSKDLNKDSASPLKYRLNYQGKQDLRLGISYTFGVGENWDNRILFDVSTKRGVAGGFATDYKNPNHKEAFNAFNYYAHDIATNDSDKMKRYRFQGKYTNLLFNDKVGLRASYDKLSDSSFSADFTNRGLDSGRAGPTEAQFTRKVPNWVSSLNTKVRLNQFQTVKQQLPLFQFNARPIQLGQSKWVLDNRFNAGYLNYLYALGTPDVQNFHSSRAEIKQKLYRSFPLSKLSVTPSVGYRLIGYGNSPQQDSRLLAQGVFGFECHTRLMREGQQVKSALEPYAQYEYFTQPTVKPPEHYLFDLQDGLYRQHSVRFGARNFLYFPKSQLNFDLYSRAFFEAPNIGSKIPKIYLDGAWKATPYSLYSINSAWDTQRNNLDHINGRVGLTISEDIALALEYRHRNTWSWRKVDPENFMIDAFRPQHELRNSLLSDRRNTVLAHLFFRLSPRISAEFVTRHGWRRQHTRPYTEYEVNVFTLLRGMVKLTFSFRHRETGNDYSIDFSLGHVPSGDTTFKKLGQGNYEL